MNLPITYEEKRVQFGLKKKENIVKFTDEK